MISSFTEAVKMNTVIPCDDIILDKDGYAYYKIVTKGDVINTKLGFCFVQFYNFFIQRHNSIYSTDKDNRSLVLYLSKTFPHKKYLSARSTFPCFYFSSSYDYCFKGAVGLDVGCIVLSSPKKYVNESLYCTKTIHPLGKEKFLPHYMHYRFFGCVMQGIDICIDKRISGCIKFGDLRHLNCSDSLIDFFTIAMIMGPGNPCNTYLDVSLCIFEIKRTLSPNGIVYIADYFVSTALLLFFHLGSFRVFINQDYNSGIPVGIFLVHDTCNVQKSRFKKIINILANAEINFKKDRIIKIINRNLIENLIKNNKCKSVEC